MAGSGEQSEHTHFQLSLMSYTGAPQGAPQTITVATSKITDHSSP